MSPGRRDRQLPALKLTLVLAALGLGALGGSAAQARGRSSEAGRQDPRFAPGAVIHDGPVSRSAVLGSLRELERKGAASGMKLTVLSPPRSRYTVVKVDLPATAPGATNVCVSSGIHYEEAFQGVRQAQSFLGSVLTDPSFRSKFDLTMLFTLPIRSMTRYSRDPDKRRLVRGKDLNRTFAPGKEIQETRLLMNAVAGRRFDLFVDLHADSRLEGFLLINESRGRNYNSWKLMTRALSAVPRDALVHTPSDPEARKDYRMGRVRLLRFLHGQGHEGPLQLHPGTPPAHRA